jgi:alginate O-acetyltransferase complex protein AlgI
MLGLNGLPIRPETAWMVSREAMTLLLVAIGITIAEPRARHMWEPQISVGPDGVAVATTSLVKAIGLSVLAVLCLMRLAEQTYSPFLYFQF